MDPSLLRSSTAQVRGTAGAACGCVRKGEGMMNEGPSSPWCLFYPNGLNYLEITLLGSPRSIGKTCPCGEAEFCLSHSCVFKLVLVVGNGLFGKTGTSARNYLFPAFFFFRCGIWKEPHWFCDHGKICFHWGKKIFCFKVFIA